MDKKYVLTFPFEMVSFEDSWLLNSLTSGDADMHM